MLLFSTNYTSNNQTTYIKIVAKSKQPEYLSYITSNYTHTYTLLYSWNLMNDDKLAVWTSNYH